MIRFRRRVDVVRHTAALWLRNGAPRALRPLAPAEQGDAGERASFLSRLDAAVQAADASRDRFAVVVARVAVAPGEGPAPAGAVPWDALSQRMLARLRHTDVMARLRGNEFALLLKDADCAERAAAAIRALCEEAPLQDAQGAQWRVRAATGSSAFPADGADAIGLLRRAGEMAGAAHWPRAVASAPAAAAEPAAALDVAEEPAAAPDAVVVRAAAPAVAQQPHQRSAAGADLERLLALAGMQRRVVRAGEIIYRAGTPFRDVHVLHVGLCKLMMLSSNGHEELGSLLFKGDWLGLDGLDLGVHRYTALAIDTGELWSVRYDGLMQLASCEPGLLKAMHSAMVRQSSRDRDAVLMQHVLPADGKVADFLARWAENLERSGLRGDQLVLPVTRAEIGAHLGLRLESVSRAVSRLEREGLIAFGPRNRREIQIPRLHALREFVSRSEREA